MRIFLSPIVMLMLLLTCTSVNAQRFNTTVESTTASKLGKTRPISELTSRDVTKPSKKAIKKMQKMKPANFPNRKGGQKVRKPHLERQGADAIRQAEFGNVIIEPFVNIEGLDIESSPHDPTGDVGRNHYVQAINVTEIGVYSKEGELLAQFAANTLWQPLGRQSVGDPIVLYDQEFDRWIITEFPENDALLVAISADDDPLGAYDVYEFETPSFPDYPKYGLWNNALTVTTNEFGNNPESLVLYAIDREGLLSGAQDVTIQRIVIAGSSEIESGFFVATPVDWTGSLMPEEGTGPYFLRLDDSSWGAADQDQVLLFETIIDFDDPNNTMVEFDSITLSPFDSYPCNEDLIGDFPCIEQPGGGTLDGLPEVIMNQAHYRNFASHQSMVFTFVTDVTDGDNLAGIRWVELRKAVGSDWTLYQEGTYAPDDGLERFMSSICIDASGNIALGFNVVSETEFVGVRFTGRRSTDPLGKMTIQEFTAAVGENEIDAFGRFGDYSHMTVDPINGRSFWFTAEYAEDDITKTRIVAFEMQKDTNDLSVSGVIHPKNSSSLNEELLTVEIINAGLLPKSSFDIGYVFGAESESISITYDLMPDSTYRHTFSKALRFDSLGKYPLQTYVFTEIDDNRLNDTLNSIIEKFPVKDVAAVRLNLPQTIICSTQQEVSIEILNRGTATAKDLVIDWYINAVKVKETIVSDSLVFNRRLTVNETLEDYVSDSILVKATIRYTDDEVANNEAEGLIRYDANAISYTLKLQTDDFPDETTWVIQGLDENVLAFGGPYSDEGVYEIDFCVQKDSCYVFTIFDAWGDGLAGLNGSGNYQILNQNGEIVTSIMEVDFGESEVNEFCEGPICNLAFDVDLSAVSVNGAADGMIIVSTTGGVPPFRFSLDDGMNFDDNNTFSGLASGPYTVVVEDSLGCTFTQIVNLPNCNINPSISVIHESASGVNDGRITIDIPNIVNPVQYSIDGGMTFVGSNVFSDLSMGEYQLVIIDGYDCSWEMTVVVDLTSSSEEVNIVPDVVILPNPTDGLFSVNLTDANFAKNSITIEVFDPQGKRVREDELYKYDQTYRTTISLVSLPAQTYFIRINHPYTPYLYRVVKY